MHPSKVLAEIKEKYKNKWGCEACLLSMCDALGIQTLGPQRKEGKGGGQYVNSSKYSKFAANTKWEKKNF